MSFKELNDGENPAKADKKLTPEEKQKQDEERSIRKVFAEINAGKENPAEPIKKD